MGDGIVLFMVDNCFSMCKVSFVGSDDVGVVFFFIIGYF